MECYVFTLDNIHCHSCKESIVQVLGPLVDPAQVMVNIETQQVTVAVAQRSEELRRALEKTLYNAGFDIIEEDAQTVELEPKPWKWWSRRRHNKTHHANCEACQVGKSHLQGNDASDSDSEATEVKVVDPKEKIQRYRVTFSVGGMTCAACQNSVSEGVKDAVPEVQDFAVDLMTKSAMAIVEDKRLANRIQNAIQDVGYECEILEIVPIIEYQNLYKIIASIGGMTCASCVNAIKEQTKILPFVKEAEISLMEKAGVFVIEDQKLNLPKLKEAIEDTGYDFELVSATPNVIVKTQSRTVNLEITGMFCDHCPERVNELFSTFGNAVTVEDPISRHHPYIKFTYVPNVPATTIRSILAQVKDISPEFNVKIVHPPTLEERAQEMAMRERKSLLYRAIFSVVTAIPTFILGIVGMSLLPAQNSLRVWLDEPIWAGSVARVTWALFIMATFVYFYSANAFHIKAYKEIRSLYRSGVSWKRRFFRFGSMNLLMSLGTSIAYFASIALLALSAHSKNSGMKMSSDNDHKIGYTTTYFDSVVFLTMFLLLGRLLEAYSKAKTASAVSLLGNLRPKTVHLIENYQGSGSASETTVVPIDMIETGDFIKVLAGMAPPADSTVIEGTSTWDESALTGESVPVEHATGTQIYAGTINAGGVPVIAKVLAVEGASMLDQIVDAVREGQLHRAPIERVADRITGIFVPLVTLIAVSTWIIWLALGLSGALPQSYLDIEIGGWVVWSMQFAISVFVVACPCGIGLAAPTALFVGTGLAAKYGILAKGGGEAFQEGSRIDVICFDKTGTLTEGGEPQVTDELILLPGEYKNIPVLQLARDLELSSTHPLGIAIRNHVEKDAEKNIQNPVFNFESLTETAGRGLLGSLPANNFGISQVLIGNSTFLSEHGCELDSITASSTHKWQTESKTVVFLAFCLSDSKNGAFLPGLALSIADPIRPEAPAVLKRLQEEGIQTWMITGDHQTTALAVAAQVGVPETQVLAGVLPSEKADRVKYLQRTAGSVRGNPRAVVAMVGDGINDAPSLSSADVGIAIGSGSDIALSSAKFVLLSSSSSSPSGNPDYLNSILVLIDLSRKTFNRVKFNFAWALVYNIIAIPIAAGVIYPYKNSRLDPVWAALAMALSSVSVITSSLLLKLYKPKIIEKK